MATDETALREQIKCDFGFDLPIGSGSASSRDDPLVILASDPRDVALTEMLLLRCFGKCSKNCGAFAQGSPWKDVGATSSR